MTYKGSSNHHGPSRDAITEETGDGNDLTVSEDVEVVFADTSGGSPLTVTIPESEEVDGRRVEIVDEGGNAATQNITVTAGSGNDVNGSDQDITLSTNFVRAVAVFNGAQSAWTVTTSAP
jgi:hypothetical protein